MESNRTKLSEDLASALERDLKGFVEKILSTEIVGEIPEQNQANILLKSALPSPSSSLGKNLMQELLYPTASDTVVKVDEEKFLCHKKVLTSRCEYFKAMLQNKWNEGNTNEITLNNVKPNAVATMLCFFYGASSELPKFCSLLDILQISDMFGVIGLTAVVKHHIKVEMCHSFHKPCPDCISSAPDVIQLSSLFSLTNLFESCMKWNAIYFYKIWPTRTFASLQTDVREKCLKTVINSMTVNNTVNLLMKTDKLLSSTTRVQWTKPVVTMATQLMTSCCDFIGSNFLELAKNGTIIVLFQGMGWKTDVIEKILTDIGDKLTNDNVCDAHLAVSRLMYLADKEDWNTEFLTIIIHLKKKTWNFLVSNYYFVIHTESWHLMSSNDKMLIKSETLSQGDENRKLTKKPVLSSSLARKSAKPISASTQRKMKPKKQRKVKPVVVLASQNLSDNSQNSLSDEVDEPPTLVPIISQEELLIGFITDVTVEPEPW